MMMIGGFARNVASRNVTNNKNDDGTPRAFHVEHLQKYGRQRIGLFTEVSSTKKKVCVCLPFKPFATL